MFSVNLSAEQQLRFWSMVDVLPNKDECWQWLGSCLSKRGGYGQVGFNYKKYRAHRIAYVLVKGPIPSAQVVRHTCDNPKCCNPGHLELGTQQENLADMDLRGRRARKLTEEKIHEIRQSPPGNYKQLAERYGVSVSRIFRVRQATRDPENQ